MLKLILVLFNMKSVLCVVLFLVIASVTLSSASLAIGQYKDPKLPGKCAIRTNLILSAGETIKNPDGECAQITCGEESFARFETCGTQRFAGCILGDYLDESLPYPECCKREKICQ